MKRIIKNNLLGFILGIIVTTALTVSASILYQASEIGYTPKDSTWKKSNGDKIETIEDAIDELYLKTDKKFCELKEGTALTIGSMYECDPGDGIKRNFFVLAVDTNKVKLIMEHNITEGTGTTTMTWMNAMKYISNNNLQTTWSNVLDIDLPSAQDIANAVGNTSWKVEDKNYDGWFYLDPSNGTYGQTQVANSSNLSNYRWLYNYTIECKDNGCDAATSLGEGEAYGYWTRDVIAQQKDSTSRIWVVGRRGDLAGNDISNETHRGVRPVITVLKSSLQ